MAGQIIPRGRNKWLVRIYVGRHPKTGKHKYVGKVINGTKKDAQAYLNAKLREQDMGQLIEPTKLTLKDYLDRWLTEAAASSFASEPTGSTWPFWAATRRGLSARCA